VPIRAACIGLTGCTTRLVFHWHQAYVDNGNNLAAIYDICHIFSRIPKQYVAYGRIGIKRGALTLQRRNNATLIEGLRKPNNHDIHFCRFMPVLWLFLGNENGHCKK